MWAPSLIRGRVCSFQLLLGLISAGLFGFEFHGTHGYVLLSHFFNSLNLEGQVPVFIYPRDRVSQSYPQALILCSHHATTELRPHWNFLRT
jgi:hypothetical protein